MRPASDGGAAGGTSGGGWRRGGRGRGGGAGEWRGPVCRGGARGVEGRADIHTAWAEGVHDGAGHHETQGRWVADQEVIRRVKRGEVIPVCLVISSSFFSTKVIRRNDLWCIR